MRKFFCIVLASACAWVGFAKQEQKPAMFKAGDKIGFVGDSITHGGFYIENLATFYVTRFPDQALQLHNFGISGDSAGGILARMEDDIKPIKVDYYTLMIGMNDVGRNKFAEENRSDPKLQEKILSTRKGYTKNLTKVCDILAANSKKMIVFTPSIYDQTSVGKTKNLFGVNDELKVFGDICRELATKHNAKVVDMWTYMENLNKELQKVDPKKSVISADRVHPRDQGGFVMAAKFIIDLGEPKFVSDIAFDAKKGLTKSFNADVKDVKISQDALSFTALEAALPFPTSKVKDEADAVLKFLDEYNKQILQVSNLDAGNYELKIDGKPIAKFSAEELAKGVNLAKIKTTPQYKQAIEVAKLTKKFKSDFNNFRAVRATEYFLGLRKKCKTEEELIAKCIEIINSDKKPKNLYVLNLAKKYPESKPKQEELRKTYLATLENAYKVAQPVSHNFELIKIK